MTQPNRLPEGGRVNRARTLDFTFNGRKYTGFHGDTLASALLANGVRLVGRSFKYHRPRGILGSGVEEPNALVQLGTGAQTLPNYVATQIELYDGLEAASVNCWPSVGFDLHAVYGLISRFLPPGFYYKTFMWPRSLWPFYERRLRWAAGLGIAPTEPDTDRYDKMHAHCDVLVVGAGPAGIAAALEAGRTGARVIVVDEQQELGGSLLASRQRVADAPAAEWLESALADLRGMDEVRLLPRSTAFGYYDHNFVGVLERADRPPWADPRLRAAAAHLANQGEAGRPGDRRHRAPAGLPKQRPPRRDARLSGVDLRAPLRRRTGASPRPVRQQRQRVPSRRSTSSAPGVEVRAVVDLRPEPRRRAAEEGCRQLGIEVLPGQRAGRRARRQRRGGSRRDDASTEARSVGEIPATRV